MRGSPRVLMAAVMLLALLGAAGEALGQVRVTVVARMEPFARTLLAGAAGDPDRAGAPAGAGDAAGRTGPAVVWQASDEPHGGRVRRVDVERVGRAEATELDCLRVAEAAGARPGEGPGRFEGLAVDGEDVVVLWRGRVQGRSSLVLARWSPRERTVRIEADNDLIAEASDLGATLVLAEAELVQSGRTMWVVLRHVDRMVLFRREAAGFGLGTRVDPDRSDGEEAIPWTDPQLRPGAGFEDGLVWTHRVSGQIWAMTHRGDVRQWTRLQGLSTATTPAVADRAPQAPRVILIGSHTPRLTHRGPLALTRANLPVLLWIERDGELGVFERAAFEAPPNYPLYAIHPQTLVPLEAGRFLAYCRTTGDLLRIEIDP